MSASRSFDLARLQLRHPDAFFCSLSYGRYKYLNQTTDLYLYLRIGILIMITGFCCLCFSLPFYPDFVTSKYQALSAGTIVMIGMLYPYIWRAQFQAKYSSARYAKRLQLCLYMQTLIAILSFINYQYFHSAIITLPCLALLAFSSLVPVLVEPCFRVSTRSTLLVRLQKIRQLAYWSYQQSQSKEPEPVPYQKDLKQYYLDLHHSCMLEEQKLLDEIHYKNIKDVFSDH